MGSRMGELQEGSDDVKDDYQDDVRNFKVRSPVGDYD